MALELGGGRRSGVGVEGNNLEGVHGTGNKKGQPVATDGPTLGNQPTNSDLWTDGDSLPPVPKG
jgi:hypothetical protein